MKTYLKTVVPSLFLILLSNLSALAQYEGDDDPNDITNFKRNKGFYIGGTLGLYVPNKYTASNFDGYGFDLDGNKNSFENSWMYQKIHLQYGGEGGYNQTDQIAVALGVDPSASPKDWTFDKSDMPPSMKYSAVILLGINTEYIINKKNGIIFNANFVNLNAAGNFTITTRPKSNATQINKSIKTFGIIGKERRLLLQLGYQRILGDNQKTNFFIEGGFNLTATKFGKNEIKINNLTIDLVGNYNQIAYPMQTYYNRKPNKTGLGVFAGLGLDLVIGKKVLGQVVYQPTYEKINIGPDPKLKLQHSLGLRVYYRL